MTLKALVRALVNRPENPALTVAVAAPARAAGPALRQGDSILSLILAIAIDREMVETISKILKPSIGVDGVVALNIFGLRDIALLVSPGAHSIRLIDLNSGRSMSFRVEGPAGMSANQTARALGPSMGQTTGGGENFLPQAIAAFRQWLSMYVFNGFTLTVLGLISIFWFVWNIARRER